MNISCGVRPCNEVPPTGGSMDWQMENGGLNCWEFKQCGREPGGKNAVLTGVCPAAAAYQADGIHGGTNGGRCCWVAARTHLTGVEKFGECRECDFYESVRKEEQSRFKVVLTIMHEMKKRSRPMVPAESAAVFIDF